MSDRMNNAVCCFAMTAMLLLAMWAQGLAERAI